MAAEEKPAESAAASPPPAAGGFKAWLPLILTVVLMPVLAWATTTFLLLPKLKAGLGTQTAHAREGGEVEHGGHGSESGSRGNIGAKPKTKHQLDKMVVNVSGSGGARLLLVSLTLAGNGSDFRSKVEENTDQLRDIASGILGNKTITDLERPDARNVLRAELLSQFNAALGDGTVAEIYITEMAIQ